jgi:hypothetical protein
VAISVFSNICSLSKNMVNGIVVLSDQDHLNIEWVPPEKYHNQVNNCLFDFDQSSEQLFYLKLENFVIANLIDWIFYNWYEFQFYSLRIRFCV